MRAIIIFVFLVATCITVSRCSSSEIVRQSKSVKPCKIDSFKVSLPEYEIVDIRLLNELSFFVRNLENELKSIDDGSGSCPKIFLVVRFYTKRGTSFLQIKASKAYALKFKAFENSEVNTILGDFGFGVTYFKGYVVKFEGRIEDYSSLRSDELISSVRKHTKDNSNHILWGYADEKNKVWNIDLTFQRETIFEISSGKLESIFSDF